MEEQSQSQTKIVEGQMTVGDKTLFYKTIEVFAQDLHFLLIGTDKDKLVYAKHRKAKSFNEASIRTYGKKYLSIPLEEGENVNQE